MKQRIVDAIQNDGGHFVELKEDGLYHQVTNQRARKYLKSQIQKARKWIGQGQE
jgi:hypothetical protein